MSLPQIVDSAVDIIKGHIVTLVNFFRGPVTYQYPDERREPFPGFRGRPALVTDPVTEKPRCTACGICARNCPPGIIEVEGEKGEDGKKVVTVYNMDFSRCMVCGLCVESCSFGALVMTPEFELSEYRLEDLVYNLDRLLELGRPYSLRVPERGGKRGETA